MDLLKEDSEVVVEKVDIMEELQEVLLDHYIH
jgi:hypothetical protein